VTQDATTVEIEAEALSIPESLTVSIEGAEEGTQILASEVPLPSGVTLVSDPEMLVVNIVAAPSAEEMDAEGSGEEAAEPAGEATEGGEAGGEAAESE
jgi:large subunit ribosomal protein L25